MSETYGRIARAQSWQRAGARWVVAGLVLGAMLLAGCAPSFDPTAKADIDGRLAALQEAGKTVPAPPGFDPMPLATGQWVQYKMIDDKGRPSFLTYKVLAEQAGAYWIETLHETYFGRTAQKMLIAFGSRTDPNRIEVRALVVLDQRGNVTLVSPERIPVAGGGDGARGPLRGLLPHARRRPVGALAQPRRFLAAPGRSALGAGAQPRRGSPVHHGPGRLRDHRRDLGLLADLEPTRASAAREPRACCR
jgi:hypothetical protein